MTCIHSNFTNIVSLILYSNSVKYIPSQGHVSHFKVKMFSRNQSNRGTAVIKTKFLILTPQTTNILFHVLTLSQYTRLHSCSWCKSKSETLYHLQQCKNTDHSFIYWIKSSYILHTSTNIWFIITEFSKITKNDQTSLFQRKFGIHHMSCHEKTSHTHDIIM